MDGFENSGWNLVTYFTLKFKHLSFDCKDIISESFVNEYIYIYIHTYIYT